jgi:hypothetical protein
MSNRGKIEKKSQEPLMYEIDKIKLLTCKFERPENKDQPATGTAWFG